MNNQRVVYINNFKCFSSHTEIEISNLTINVGENSVGKSTFIQAILILREAFEKTRAFKDSPSLRYKICLNDNYALQLGTFSHITSSRDYDDIMIGINNIEFSFCKVDNDELSMGFDGIKHKWHQFKDALFSAQLYYLNAERKGPRNYQVLKADDNIHCGYYGEQTFAIARQWQGNDIREMRRFRSNTKIVPKFSKQVEYWMQYIVSGIELTFDKNTEDRVSRMKVKQASNDTGFSSPNNYGFGISYVLPIIVTGLIAESGSTIIVENPEAHLHPKGQSHIGEFLAQISNDNVNVIIETHSEHIVNGIRIYALKNGMDPDEICLNYFSQDDSSKKLSVKRIRLNPLMELLEWPEGFFDQEETDLKTMRLLRKEIKKSDQKW